MRADLKMSRRVRRRGSVAALLLALFPIASTQPRTAPAAAYPEPPQVLFKDLFVAVQSAAIYQDGKAFPDATPNAAPADILAQYHAVAFRGSCQFCQRFAGVLRKWGRRPSADKVGILWSLMESWVEDAISRGERTVQEL